MPNRFSLLHTFTGDAGVVGDMTLGHDGSIYGSLTAISKGGSIVKLTP